MADLQVAQTILQQLGGRHFTVMTGAKNFVGSENSLSFRIPGSGFAKDGINAVRVTLNASDLYDVVYSRVRGKSIKVLHTQSNIYGDKLAEAFRLATGLNTSLGGLPYKAIRQFNNRHED